MCAWVAHVLSCAGSSYRLPHRDPPNDANGDFKPTCALPNFNSNGECGQISNSLFGGTKASATTYDDAITQGFGNRNYTWDMSAEVVHELATGGSLTAGYYRNWAGNFRTDDNVEIAPSDFSPYCVTTPTDSRLPGGGGQELCGLYDINPSAYGKSRTVVKDAGGVIGSTSGITCGQQRTSSGLTFPAAVAAALRRRIKSTIPQPRTVPTPSWTKFRRPIPSQLNFSSFVLID